MSEIDTLSVECCDCGEAYTVADVNADRVRFHLPNGNIARFGKETTQAKIDGLSLRCECCQEDLEEDY